MNRPSDTEVSEALRKGNAIHQARSRERQKRKIAAFNTLMDITVAACVACTAAEPKTELAKVLDAFDRLPPEIRDELEARIDEAD